MIVMTGNTVCAQGGLGSGRRGGHYRVLDQPLLRAYGEIYGYAFASYALAGALGPWLMGMGFDRFGS
jgi:hypothetical protein